MLARAAYYYLLSMRTYKLSRPELEDLQSKKLRRVLSMAYSSTRLYRSRFKILGKKPDDIRSVEDLAVFPLLTKSDVAANYPDGLLSRRIDGERVTTGTGTTGEVAHFAQSREWRDITRGLSYRRRIKAGVRPWSRVVTTWIPMEYWRRLPDTSGALRPHTALYDSNLRFLAGRGPLTVIQLRDGGMAEEVRQLNRARPDFIYGRPSYLRRLARTQGEALHVRPKAVFATGEPVTDTGVKEIEAAFGARVFSSVASSDLGAATAVPCERYPGMHFNEDYMLCEVLKGGEQVGPGETGELVVTQFHNDLMPLIRYATGDLVELGEDGRCGCGSSLMRMARTKGRAADFLLSKEGTKLPAMAIANDLESRSGLRDFQVVQESAEKLRIRITPEDEGKSDALQEATRYLEELIGPPVKIAVETRSPEEFWGKYRAVRCLVAPKTFL